MEITLFHTSELATDTYVAINGDRAFVVDPGGSADEIMRFVESHGAKVEAVLLTHGHYDHIFGVAPLQEQGALVIMHKDDVHLVKSFKNLAFWFNKKVPPFTPDITLSGGETLNVAGLDVKVLHTPGHTAGGVCYVVGDCIFSGDTLFELSYGRTDFYTGSFAQLKNSIVNKLFRLEGDYKVYPGHNNATTLDFERKNNPILRDTE